MSATTRKYVSPLSLSIDVHNTEGHVLIWEGEGKTPIVDAEDERNKGAGTFWGLDLSKASVNDVAVSKAHDEH